MTPNLCEALLGQKCRPMGAGPQPAAARQEDYYYTVVTCWLEPRAFSQVDATPIGWRMMCALVSDATGGTNVLPFLELEFGDLSWSE